MSVEAFAYERLSNWAELTALVGDRIRPGKAKQEETEPYITFGVVSVVGEHHLDGPSNLAAALLTVNSWGPDPSVLAPVADSVRHALDGYRGELGGIIIRACRLEIESSTWEPREDGGDALYWRRWQDFRVHFVRTNP